MKYKLKCKYKTGVWEEIDTAKDKEEADYLLNEYQIAYGNDYIIRAIKL